MDNRFDGFAVNLYLDDEESWLAHFVELPEVALAELASAWDAMKATYIDEGLPVPVAPARKSYSGAFNVRVDRSLHRALAIEAARQGISLNAIVAKKLSETTCSV